MLVHTHESRSVIPAKGRPLFKVVVCGEVNSGKSTVLNAVLRGRLLPDNIGQTDRPLITARYRGQPGADVYFTDGRKETFDDTTSPERLRGAERVRLWSDVPQIDGFEFIELPLTTAEDVTEDEVDVVRSADALIWVTIASQAWRLTEKSILARFGKALPERSLIVVSRADKLRNATDRDKLRGRVERETSDHFDACVFLNGANRTLDAATKTSDKWSKSGGVEILEHLHGFAGLDMADLEATAPLEREPAVEPAPRSDADPDSDQTPDPVSEHGAENLFDLSDYRDTPDLRIAASSDIDPKAGHDDGSDAEPPMMFETVRKMVAQDDTSSDRIAVDDSDAPSADDDIETTLARIARRLPEGSIVGLMPAEGDTSIVRLLGDREWCVKVGDALKDWIEHLRAAYILNELDPDPDALMLTNETHRIACEFLPRYGTVYLLADAERVSLGAAKSLMIQMRCATAIRV